MLIFITHPQRRIIAARDFEDFLSKYRRGSLRPEANLEAFMKACAERAAELDITLDPSTPDNFVISLLQAEMISLAKSSLQ